MKLWHSYKYNSTYARSLIDNSDKSQGSSGSPLSFHFLIIALFFSFCSMIFFVFCIPFCMIHLKASALLPVNLYFISLSMRLAVLSSILNARTLDTVRFQMFTQYKVFLNYFALSTFTWFTKGGKSHWFYPFFLRILETQVRISLSSISQNDSLHFSFIPVLFDSNSMVCT